MISNTDMAQFIETTKPLLANIRRMARKTAEETYQMPWFELSDDQQVAMMLATVASAFEEASAAGQGDNAFEYWGTGPGAMKVAETGVKDFELSMTVHGRLLSALINHLSDMRAAETTPTNETTGA